MSRTPRYKIHPPMTLRLWLTFTLLLHIYALLFVTAALLLYAAGCSIDLAFGVSGVVIVPVFAYHYWRVLLRHAKEAANADR